MNSAKFSTGSYESALKVHIDNQKAEPYEADKSEAEKPKFPTLSRARIEFKIDCSDGYSCHLTNDSKLGNKDPMAVTSGALEELARVAALYSDTDGQEVIDIVTSVVNRIRSFKEKRK